jgi:hypothetical protein
MKLQASAWLPVQVSEPTEAEHALQAAFEAKGTRTATAVEMHVWPAHLPAGARWLPYSAEPSRVSTTFVAPAPAPVAEPAPRQPLPIHFWRLLLLAALGAALMGILGGLGVGLLVGAH